MATGDDVSESSESTGATSEEAPSGPFPTNRDTSKEAPEAELNQVKALKKEYDKARKHDQNARRQYATDRRYAAGNQDLTWAVNSNLIGSFIDILVSTLYAKDPDLNVKRSPTVDETNGKQMEDFARTCELVVSHQWKRARLKKVVRKQIRSVLSVGPGWFKGIYVKDDKKPKEGQGQPEMESVANDVAETQARLDAKREEIEALGQSGGEELDALQGQLDNLKADLKRREQVAAKKSLVIDFIPAEHMQVSLDVACLDEHLDADWNSNEIFVPTCDLQVRFPDLEEDDVNSAKKFYQRQPKDQQEDLDLISPLGSISAEQADMWITENPNNESEPFAKVIELWDRRDRHVKTMVDGVKRWAKQPYQPEYATSRFYPYFYLAFFEVDGQRHPQSLVYRLHKLQDEYACSRSNQRLTRERSIPGVMFNASQVSDTQASKIASSKQQEMIPVQLTDASQPMGNAFAAKPVGQYDPRIYDTTPVISDMERISGVQEAQQATAAVDKTATEASIQQQGFQSRTGADRDEAEEMLTDFAQMCIEADLQCMPTEEAQRIAGPHAFWPYGMDLDDLLTMVSIGIKAGTTGKPLQGQDQTAWTNILPILRETIQQIKQAVTMGDLDMANVLKNIVAFTMRRFGDDIDVTQFLPKIPTVAPPPLPPPPPPPPQVKVSLTGAISPMLAQELAEGQHPIAPAPDPTKPAPVDPNAPAPPSGAQPPAPVATNGPPPGPQG